MKLTFLFLRRIWSCNATKKYYFRIAEHTPFIDITIYTKKKSMFFINILEEG